MTATQITITDPVPIACSLTADEYRQRVADAGQVARDALRARTPIDGGVRLAFTDTGDVHVRLEEFVAAESKCCPFLAMDLGATACELILDVTGPADAAPIIEELFA